MKNSKPISAKTETAGSGNRKTGSSSPRHEGFPLIASGDLPDPDTHAWRGDLADVALAGQIIVSHYARPVARILKRDARLRRLDGDDAELIAELEAGAPFDLLDSRGGWAWGYGGTNRRVGYLKVEALA